jgi:molybdopterin-guanine dinucleotide biosynthesis protein A
MPFLNRAFMEYLVSRAAGYDIVVPETPDGLQPLNAVYARRCLPVIRGLLDRNRLKISGFYPEYPLLKIPPETIRPFDPEGRMFMNINTPEELTKLFPAPQSANAPQTGENPQAEIP